MSSLKIFQPIMKLLMECQSDGVIDGFALIGATAASYWGRVRATLDIDFLVPFVGLDELAKRSGGELRLGDAGDPLRGSVTLSAPQLGSYDLIALPPAWEALVLGNVENLELDDLKIPVADWRALVLLKCYAGSALDLEDAEELCRLHLKDSIDRNWLETNASRLRVSIRLSRVLRQFSM